MDDTRLMIEAIYAWWAITGRDPKHDDSFSEFMKNYLDNPNYRHTMASLALVAEDYSWKRYFMEIRKERHC